MSDHKVRLLRSDACFLNQDASFQQTLFPLPEDGEGRYSFIQIDNLDEGRLIAVLVRNAVSMLIDVRPIPVFSVPNFVHRDVSSFLFSNNVQYLELAMCARYGRVDMVDVDAFYPRKLPGLTLCLFDDAARERGWLDFMRQSFRRSEYYTTEINPRSLAGVAA